MTTRLLTLPIDSTERKGVPMFTGLIGYFPAALAGVASHSKKNNDKHNPGQPLHHARGKSGDHADCIARHLVDLGDLLARIERDPQLTAIFAREPVSPAVLDEANALCWRALALSQELHERFGAPLAPSARLPEELSPTAKPAHVADEHEQATFAPLTDVDIRTQDDTAEAQQERCPAVAHLVGQCALLAGHDGNHRGVERLPYPETAPQHTCTMGNKEPCAACIALEFDPSN